jgi:hypothetical protein
MNPTEAVERLRSVIRRQHKTPATEQSYVHWLRHYMAALGEMPPNLSSEQKLERFLTDLAVKKNVAASTQNQAFNAILSCSFQNRNFVCEQNRTGSEDGDMEQDEGFGFLVWGMAEVKDVAIGAEAADDMGAWRRVDGLAL